MHALLPCITDRSSHCQNLRSRNSRIYKKVCKERGSNVEGTSPAGPSDLTRSGRADVRPDDLSEGTDRWAYRAYTGPSLCLRKNERVYAALPIFLSTDSQSQGHLTCDRTVCRNMYCAEPAGVLQTLCRHSPLHTCHWPVSALYRCTCQQCDCQLTMFVVPTRSPMLPLQIKRRTRRVARTGGPGRWSPARARPAPDANCGSRRGADHRVPPVA